MSQRRFAPSFQWILSVALCGSCMLASCGGGGGTNPPAPPTLQSITVSPQGATLPAGLTQQYSATGSYSDGTSKVLSPVTWSTSNSAMATVNSTGLVTAVKQGAVTLSAASGTTTGSTPLTVGPPNLLSLSVSPQNPTVSTGESQQFMATGTYTDGSTQDLTHGATWSSGTATVATVGNAGYATSLTAGTAAIQVASGSIDGSTTLTVAASMPRTITYLMGSTFPSGGTLPKGVVVADFNGDGKLDIAVSNFNTNIVAVFLNDGSGNFGDPILTTVQIPNGLGPLVVEDFNEDGITDLVVATIAGPQVNIVLLGNGDGTFRQQAPIPNSFGFLRAKVVDLNGDGHQDLVLAENGSIAVSMGRGDGTFVDTLQLPSGSFPGLYLGITVADFNGDGKLDIVASDAGSPSGGFGKLVFYPGNGDGTFGTPNSVDFPLTFPTSLATGDFNGDGKRDILVGFPNNGLIAFGHGDGTFDLINMEFAYSTAFTTTAGGVTVFAADLTRVGKSDAVTADFNTGNLQIALNRALGNAPPADGIFSFALAPGLSDIAVGDLNGDGVLDVVVTNFQTSQITIVLSKKQ